MAIGISAAIGIGLKLIDKLFPDPTAKAAAQAKLIALEQQGALQEINAAMNIIVTEAKSEHKLTATWRPITMLTFVLIIANNYILAPYLDMIFGTGVQLELPPDMWTVLKIGLGGYVVGRSGEKIMKEYIKGNSPRHGGVK